MAKEITPEQAIDALTQCGGLSYKNFVKLINSVAFVENIGNEIDVIFVAPIMSNNLFDI